MGPGLPPHPSPHVASWPDTVEAEYTIVEPQGRQPVPAQDHRINIPRTRPHGDRDLTGRIAAKGKPAPIQAGQRWVVERTHAWVNAFNRLQRCYERRQRVVDAFISLAHAIVTLRRLIRLAWTHYRWHTRPLRRP